jgi:fumarate hydratase subunit alpha
MLYIKSLMNGRRPLRRVCSKKYKRCPINLVSTEETVLVTEKTVENVAVKLLQLAVTTLPQDVKEALQRAHREEDNMVGTAQLKAILDNVELAETTLAPMCQDTGIIIFYVKAGSQVTGLDKVEDALRKATLRATEEIPLRPNAVDPFTQKNTGNNTGRHVPYIHWKIVPGDTLEITALPKGGGSENVSVLGMLSPSQGLNGLKKFVVDAVINAGAKPCPPTVLGVAVGGGADIALKLAKETLIEPLNQPNPNPELAKLEQELLEAANSTEIGTMGLGGKTTVLDVKVDYAHRHPASYPVAVVAQCWAARRASARIRSDGTVEYLTHKVA